MRDGGVVDSNPRTVRAAFVPAGFDPHPRFRWIVVATEYGQEHAALTQIIDVVGCAFLPLFYDPPKTPGAKRVREHRARARAAAQHRARRDGEPAEPVDADPDVMPLFPGYLMAHVDLADTLWRSIRRQRGVADVVRIAGAVGIVPQAAMHRLWRQCAPDGVIRPPPAPERIQPGARVRIAYTGDREVDSPLAGIEGVCRYSSRDRVVILLDLLGRPIEVSAPGRQVEVIAAA